MTQRDHRKPLLFVVSGPSGAGKKTLLEHISAAFSHLEWVPTYTTRPPRPGEQHDVDYIFVDDERFKQMVQSGEIVECTRTYGDYWYGSPSRLWRACDGDDKDMIVELDVTGFSRVRSSSLRTVVGIFIVPPSSVALSQRIQSRAAENNVRARLEVADEQLRFAWFYDYVIANIELGSFLDQIATVIKAELLKRDGLALLFRNRHRFDSTVSGIDFDE